MATRYPPDRFDVLPDDVLRVGAHRAPPRGGRGWIAFAWAALATGLLVAAGIFALSLVSGPVDLPFSDEAGGPSGDPEPSETPVETAAPVLDPAIAITIVNGTTTPGLAAAVGDDLAAKGWCGAVAAEPVADGPCVDAAGVGSRLNAETPDVASTVVYYTDPVNEGAARALVESLGVGDVRLSQDYPQSPMVVVVGADYSTPAG